MILVYKIILFPDNWNSLNYQETQNIKSYMLLDTSQNLTLKIYMYYNFPKSHIEILYVLQLIRYFPKSHIENLYVDKITNNITYKTTTY